MMVSKGFQVYHRNDQLRDANVNKLSAAMIESMSTPLEHFPSIGSRNMQHEQSSTM
jgi:hypothetical protein